MGFNFLRSFCTLMEQTEVPPRFQIWCGIAALLSTLERRVWITQGIYNIYPNFFIVLIAASGQKKSTPINLVDKLLRRIDAGPNIIAQKVSPEALIKAIKSHETRDHTQLLKETCGGIVIADELATFLDRGSLDRGLGPVLTKLYDCSPFTYDTIARGTERVEGGYLSLLGGTTVELLRNSLPKDAIGGGFTSRTLFIYEDQRAPPVPWVEFNETHIELEEELVKYLTSLMYLKGAITVDKAAVEYFKSDYNNRYNNSNLRMGGSMANYENRRHTHLFKVAIALMVAENAALTVKAEHIHGAKVLLEEAEEKMPRVMDLILASDTGSQTTIVLNYISARGIVTHAELTKHFSHLFDTAELSRITRTLRESEQVEATVMVGKLAYKMKGHK